MRHYQILFLAITFGMSSCKTNGQEVDNTKPMYGEVRKSEEYKKIDDLFIKESLEKFRTVDSAVYVQIDYSWRYFYHNDLKTAMKRFNQAWLLNPEFPDSYFGFAALLEMQKNRPEAERFYKMALEKDKGNERAKICYQRIADCKEQLHDIEGTIEAYTRLTEINPANSFAFNKIGFYEMEKGNFTPAIKAFAKAIELDSTDATTYNNRGYLFQTNKSYINAISDYTKAIHLNPKYISAYVNRGITEMLINKNQGAKKDFEMSVQLDPRQVSLEDS